MKSRKVTLRKCLISREQYPKNDLLRVVCNKEKEVSIDVSGKANGRGAYIFLNEANLNKARKARIFEREFKIEDLSNIYDQLEEMLNEK